MITLKQAVTNPVTAVAVVVSAAAQLFQIPLIDAVFGVVWGQLSVLFTGASIFAFTVLPNVELGALEFLSEHVQVIAIVLGIAYGGKLLLQVADKIEDEIDQ